MTTCPTNPKKTTSKQERNLSVSLRVYPLEAVLSSCYQMISKCYFFLEYNKSALVRIRVRPITHCTDEEMDALMGELENELLSQALRLSIARRTRTIREMIIGRALLGVEPLDPYPSEPLQETNDNYLHDPLGIAVSWETKYSENTEKTDQDSSPDRSGASSEKDPLP